MCTSPASVICWGRVRTNSIELPVSRLASIRKYRPRKLTSRVSPDFSVTPLSAENRTFNGNIIEKRRAARLSTPSTMGPLLPRTCAKPTIARQPAATHFPGERRTKPFDQGKYPLTTSMVYGSLGMSKGDNDMPYRRVKQHIPKELRYSVRDFNN